VSPFDRKVPDSPFLSIMCVWDSGEEERLSPWDLGKPSPQCIGLRMSLPFKFSPKI